MTTAGEDAEEPLSGPFDIYETAAGPRHVGNPMRRQILAKMRGRELTVPEMIEATGLTKSTISTHLGILHDQRLLAYREDPADRRRKLYYLTSRHVGTARRCEDRQQVLDPARDLPLNATLGDGIVLRLLLRAFLTELSCCGLDLEPVARETGRRVGEIVAREQRSAGPGPWADQIGRFWTEAGLGRLRVETTDDAGLLHLRVDDCQVCCTGAPGRVGLCAITAGLIEGLASETLRTMVAVEREDPTEDGDGRCGCRFRVTIADPVALAGNAA